MAIIKCKMCGGDMELTADQRCGTCEYCGSTMTLPKVDDEQRAAAFNRGNHFRRIGEFDKALTVYERIVQEDDGDAEAHWCCALCRFGIEYVKDPASGEYLPTCHRASFDSFLEDVDYKTALEHADAVARRQYETDGEKIAQVQRGILSVSQKEQPFDVFICYKESDDQGNRTVDSTLAQDIYYQLTDEGFRVFFSRITLEDKAGQAYEPYIFAALHSAKVMIVVGTKPEYLNAVWVKNEWSRYLSIVKNDRKKLLIPCYRDMDPYDMPEQLSVLQSYDMSKIGFIQDLIRGISKVIVKESTVQNNAAEPVAVPGEVNGNLTALLKRGYMALEDQEWSRADEFFEQVLNMNAECAEAYLGKLCADCYCDTPRKLQEVSQIISANSNYKKAVRFASTEQKDQLCQWNEAIVNRLEEERERLEAERCKEQREKMLKLKEVRIRSEKMSQYVAAGAKKTIGLNVDGTVMAVGDDEYGQCDVKAWTDIIAVDASSQHTVGLKADGTVVAVGNSQYGQCKVDNWMDIIAVVARSLHTVGVKADGTVAAVGDNQYGQCNVGDWTDVVSIDANSQHTVGLKADGTVVAVGNNEYGQCNVNDWTDIVAVATGIQHTVGLKADGTVVAVGNNEYGQCNVNDWTNIVAVATRSLHTVGLKADGTVVAVGNNKHGQCRVNDWTDIVAVAARSLHTIGLKIDGTIVAVGHNTTRQCEVDNWTDIIAVTAGTQHTVGLKADGTVVAVGDNKDGRCKVNNWKLFYNIDTIDQERAEAMKRRQEEKQQHEEEERHRQEEKRRREAEEQQRREAERERYHSTLETERANLQAELPNIKGLFSGGKRKRVERRLAEITAELKKLQKRE